VGWVCGWGGGGGGGGGCFGVFALPRETRKLTMMGKPNEKTESTNFVEFFDDVVMNRL